MFDKNRFFHIIKGLDFIMDGIVLIDKEKGISSFGVVAKVRKIYNTKKVGHCGTLDPEATGVLPIMIGSATKISKYLVEHDKEYVATLKLGKKTDSADGEGNIIAEDDFKLKKENEENYYHVFEKIVGKHIQVPPMYSAIKVMVKSFMSMLGQVKKLNAKEEKLKFIVLVLKTLTINQMKLCTEFLVRRERTLELCVK